MQCSVSVCSCGPQVQFHTKSYVSGSVKAETTLNHYGITVSSQAGNHVIDKLGAEHDKHIMKIKKDMEVIYINKISMLFQITFNSSLINHFILKNSIFIS